jgi:DNA mismatch repair protein MutS2
LTGLAGSSSGIEIARRFGLPAAITERAADRVKTASAEATEYLRRLKDQFEAQRQNIAALEEERAVVAEKYAKLELQFIQKEKDREKEFRAELQKVVDEFVNKAEKFASMIEDAANARKVRKEIEKRSVELRAVASAETRKIRQQTAAIMAGETTPLEGGALEVEEGPEASEAMDLRPGDRVRLLSFDQEGVVESVGETEVVIQIGALRFREQRANLRLTGRKPETNKKTQAIAGLPKGVSVTLQEQPAVGGELNVIGKTVNEATEAADKFLDAAYLDNYDSVRIIHGIGMGALKRAIADLLSDHPHVAKWRQASPDEGGAGATVVELKK